MNDLTPHTPRRHILRWTDEALNFQELILELDLDEPVYLVGGAVRDAFLSRLHPNADFDLATPTNAIGIARKIANALDADVFVMDAERGVARVLIDAPQTDKGQRRIDVTNYRGDNLLADLQDRDFTVNAMAVDLKSDIQQIIDPMNGEADAENKRLRRCSEHAIADDPIRMLRAVRQSVQLKFRIDPETLADIRAHVDTLDEPSAERVRDEFFNILSLDKSRQAVRVLQTLGLLEQVIPPSNVLKATTFPDDTNAWTLTINTLNEVTRLMQAVSYQRSDQTAATFDLGMVAMQFDRFRKSLNAHFDHRWAGERANSTLVKLGALLHLIAPASSSTEMDADSVASMTAAQLRLSNDEKKRLRTMLNYYEVTQTIDHTDTLMMHRFWYPLKESGVDAIFLGLAAYRADAGNDLNQDDWLLQVERAVVLLNAFYDEYESIVDPPLLLDGNDVIEQFGLQGPIIGDVLGFLREQQVTGDVRTVDDAQQAITGYLEAQP